jgi:hypothetical protein
MTQERQTTEPASSIDDFVGTWKVDKQDGRRCPERSSTVVISVDEQEVQPSIEINGVTYGARYKDGVLIYPAEDPGWRGQISVCTCGQTRFLYAAVVFEDPKEVGIWGANDEPEHPPA